MITQKSDHIKLVPIILFVYNRIDCLKETIFYLQKNVLAEKSELYIFSDGPQDKRDYEKVVEVRKFINSVSGFKNVIVQESSKNKGLAESVIFGVTEVFQFYDKVIVLEDDLITSPNFLNFMNEGLNFYENDSRIWSITGYCPPIKIPKYYSNDVYLALRPSSWGWGTWKDRWDRIDWEIKEYSSFEKNRKKQKEFCRGGNDLFFMLRNQVNGKIDSWAIRWSFNQFLNSSFTVYPVLTKVQNIGFDLTATHTKKQRKKQRKISSGFLSYSFNEAIEPDKIILADFKKLHMSCLKAWVKNIIYELKI